MDLDRELINLNKKLTIFKNKNKNNDIIIENNIQNNFSNTAVQKIHEYMDISNCDHIDFVVKKLQTQKRKAVFNESSYELLKEIIELRFDIIKNIPNYFKNYKSNISFEQFKILNNCNKNKNFSIIDTDKNTGVVLVSNEICEQLAIFHLNDVSIYETLEKTQFKIYSMKLQIC
jgi:hypothetical protein